jgi:methyltransferase-like protein
VRNKEMVWRMLDNEAFIISTEGNKIHSLNKLGSFIWQLLDGKNSVQNIISCLCERFQVTEDVAQADANDFVEKLLAQGLVELSDTPLAE